MPNSDKRDRRSTLEEMLRLNEPLGGFIFVCSNETMPEDFDRRLFGLPKSYQEAVKAIQPGLPLFLYNYTTRCLHGVFEASSDGGMNLEPLAWENKECRSEMEPSSRFPAQVRVRVREIRPPLEEDKFRPLLFHYEGRKFRLELSHSETEELLKLFGVSNVGRLGTDIEIVGNEWERVKARNKLGRSPVGPKLLVPSSERRRGGTAVDPFSCTGDFPTLNNGKVEGDDGLIYSKGRVGRADLAETWRSHMDRWASVPSSESSQLVPLVIGTDVREHANNGNIFKSAIELSNGHSNNSRIESESKNGAGDFEVTNSSQACPGISSYVAALKAGMSTSPQNGSHHSIGEESNGTTKLPLRSPNGYKKFPVDKDSHEQGQAQGFLANDVATFTGSKQLNSRGNAEGFGCDNLNQATLCHEKAAEILGRLHDPDPAINSNSPLRLTEPHFGALLLSGTPLKQQPSNYDRKVSEWSPKTKTSQAPLKVSGDLRRHVNDPKNNESQSGPEIAKQRLQVGQQVSLPVLQLQLVQSFMAVNVPTSSLNVHSPQSPHSGINHLPYSEYGQGSATTEVVNGGQIFPPLPRVLAEGETGLFNPIQQGSWGETLLVHAFPSSGSASLSLPSPALSENFEALHSEILEFAKTARPKIHARTQAEAAVNCIRKAVKQLWPIADVEVFGSFATGLCLPHSDVDVVVVDVPSSSGIQMVSPIRMLAASFKGYEWCEYISSIETASMPVIKLRCRPRLPAVEALSVLPSVAIDVTLGSKSGFTDSCKSPNKNLDSTRRPHNGVVAREYVIGKLHQLPALAPLVLLMKAYLHHRGLNDVYSGGLGSYSLTLMLVFYLECIVSCNETPGITSSELSLLSHVSGGSSLADSLESSDDGSCTSNLSDTTSTASDGVILKPENSSNFISSLREQIGPSLEDRDVIIRRAWTSIDELLSSLHSSKSPNLGFLLIGFLHLFGRWDFSQMRLVLKGTDGSPGGLFLHDRHAHPTSLWIDDPLRPGFNIGAGSFAMWHVQAAMREMLLILARPQSESETARHLEKDDTMINSRHRLPHIDQLFQK